MKELLLAIAFLTAIFGTAIHQFAPEAWMRILHIFGL